MKKLRMHLCILAGAAVLGACAESPAPSQQPAPERSVRVIAEPLQFEYAGTRVEAVGTSRARLSADIYPATSGEVVAVNFEPGQFVSAGEPLVKLDRREQQLAVRLAELKLEDARRLYDRYQRSAGSGAVLPTVLDAARTAAETAEVELARARLALEERIIEAVFDGYVGATDVDVGDRITTATLITTLDDRGTLLVSFEIPEAFIGELDVGDRVGIETWSGGAAGISGEVVDIGSRIDPRNRTFAARAKVDNSEDQLRPGMSFRVGVDVRGNEYPVVSEIGVQWGADGAYVWSVVDGLATRVPVQVIQRREGRVLIAGDLQIGDIIVVEGTQRMRDGTAVSHDVPRLAGKTRNGASPVISGGSAVTLD